MSSGIFRIAAGFISVIEAVAGVSLAMMYEGWWNKLCSLSLVAMGLYFGLYAIRGNASLRNEKYPR